MSITAEGLDTLVLESKWGELQYLAKGPMQTSWRDGFPKQEPKLIILQFERFLCEVRDDIDRQELTDEDKEYLARKIEHDLRDPMFVDFWVHEKPRPGKPWATYDDTASDKIPMIAEATGTVYEALLYEQRGRLDGPRDPVVKKLQELMIELEEDEPQAQHQQVAEDDFSAV
jgi:hypothetical protein